MDYFTENNLRVLNCSPEGCKAFSPFNAIVEVFGIKDTIDEVFQKSRIFIDFHGNEILPSNGKDARILATSDEFMESSYFYINEKYKRVPSKYLVYGWYVYLWLVYLDARPDLVKYAATFDKFWTPYQGHQRISNADCIRIYVKEGRHALKARCLEFLMYLDDPKAKEYFDIWKASRV